MGYDLKLLVGEIDDQFRCSICGMILENPMVTPCNHVFCDECIGRWLNVAASCPIDSCSLTVHDLKPSTQIFRQTLDKVELKCYFGKLHRNLVASMSIKCFFFRAKRMPSYRVIGTTATSSCWV